MRRRSIFLLCGAALICAAAGRAAAGPPASPARDKQALTLLTQSLTAMASNRPVEDVKVQAQVTRTAGSDTDSGPAILEAAGYDKSLVNLMLTSGPRLETRNGVGGVWSANGAENQAVALHNTWTVAGWFAPALIVQTWLQDSSFSLAYAGVEDRGGTKAHHISASRTISGVPGIESLSATDLYLDSQSLLPLALAFNTHPDNDLGVNLPVEVTFGEYKAFGGITAPTRIQSYLQNTLLLDLFVNAASINNGFGANEFVVP